MAGPMPPSTDGPRVDTGAQGVPRTWTRLSGPNACMPEGAVRHVATYLSGRGVGTQWLRYDAADGTQGGGPVWAVPSVRGTPTLDAADLRAAVEKHHPDVASLGWQELDGFWSVTRAPTGQPLVWLGGRYFDGTAWSRDPDTSSDGATTTFERLLVADSRDGAWVPFRVSYECPPPANDCQRLGVAELRYDRTAGVTLVDPPLSPTVAAGAARYGIPDVMLVPRLDVGPAWVVGHDRVFVLPARQAVPLPRVDVQAGIAGYATAAARDLKGRLVVAMWTEQRSPRGLQHAITVHALDGTDWASEVLDVSKTPLVDGEAAFDRLTSMAFDPDGSTLWLATYGGVLARVDVSQFVQPRFVEVYTRDALGLLEGERILDVSADGSGLVVVGTTRGVIASRNACDAGGTAPPTDTPGSVMPPTDPVPATATPSPTDAVRASATPTERPTDDVRVTSTPTAPPRPIYLPRLTAAGAPGSETAPLDIVWLVDRSATMLAPFGGRRQSALATVAGVLTRRARDLGPSEQAALVAFDETTQVLTPLVGDGDAFERALAALVVAEAPEGSVLDRGLIVARRELAGPSARPSARPAVVVISDGTSTGAPSADEVAKAARGLVDAGIPVWAIGLGPGVDAAWLAAAAGADHVLRADDAVALDSAVARIARTLAAGR